jgi:hypothetical protein
MNNKNNLIKDKIYQIRYIGNYNYDSYNGIGTFTGATSIDDVDGIELFGFILPNESSSPYWFPLSSIFIND